MEERRLQAGTGGGQRQPGLWPPAAPSPPPQWLGCRADSVSVTDRALALRPGAGPPGWGGAGGFPVAAPDAAAAAAAAAASSSLPPKLVMNVIFSSRPGVGERERERDSELDSEGDLESREKELSHRAPPACPPMNKPSTEQQERQRNTAVLQGSDS